MTKAPLFATLAVLALAACGGGMPRAQQGHTNPVEAACAERNLPGTTAPAFCTCLGQEAITSTGGDQRRMETLAWFVGQNAPTVAQQWARIKASDSKGKMSVARRDWRNTMHNAQLRCMPSATTQEAFFGLPY